MTIYIPTDCEVQAKTITGKLSVCDIDAPITARVITGKVRLENLRGPVYAKVVTGNIHYLGTLTDDQHRFETTIGSVNLRLLEEPNAKVDARTTTGRIRCDFPLSEEIERRHVTGARLNAVLGSGEGEILARVVTGDLHLKRHSEEESEKLQHTDKVLMAE